MAHPRERPASYGWMKRRDFLRSSAAAVSAAGLLASCGADNENTGSLVKVATPDDPSTLPISDDNSPIDSNLEPEAGPLKIFNWNDYLWPKVAKNFGKEYGVEFEISTFYNMSEAVAKMRTGQVDYDIFFPTPDVLPKLVAGNLLQPLNHDYIPNLKANVWPELTDPFYDQDAHYTVPYFVYSTGIAWRKDMVSEDIAARPNPYDVFWDSQYSGKIGIYDDYREAIGMVLTRNGISDVNTGSSKALALAEEQLKEMADKVKVRTTIDGAYAKLPEGQFAIHQSWSGDIIAAPFYMPGDDYGDPDGLLQFWWPEGEGIVGNDTIAIPKGAKNPVLAHHFLNFLLANKNALKNFSWVGYQPPVSAMDPATLVKDGYVVPNLESAILERKALESDKQLLALPAPIDQEWQNVWSSFKSGV